MRIPKASNIKTAADWETEAKNQHACNTYLTLLGANPLPGVSPVVKSISPPQGPVTGFTPVTITGSNFTPDSVVDFGIVPGVVASVDPGGQSITALAPGGVGIVDVEVTNQLGTSSVVQNDEFHIHAGILNTV